MNFRISQLSTEKVKYFTSLSYNHVGDIFDGQDVGQGYVAAYGYDRINVPSNFDFEIHHLLAKGKFLLFLDLHSPGHK